jgi:hypothetical protein
MALAREQLDSIFAEVAKGKSVTSQLERIGVGFKAFYEALDRDPELGECYGRARKHQGEAHFGKIVEATEQVLSGKLDPNAARVAIDALKWTAARMHPTVYSEKHAIELSGPNGGPITYGWGDNAPKV